MNKIMKFTKTKDVDWPQQQEMYDRVLKLVHEYDDDISLAGCLGVLTLVGDTLMNQVRED